MELVVNNRLSTGALPYNTSREMFGNPSTRVISLYPKTEGDVTR